MCQDEGKTAKRNKRGKNGSSKWKPQVGYLVLAKCQAVSDAADGITKKFARPYDGPWKFTQVINPTACEVADEQGKITNAFNQKAMKFFYHLWSKKFQYVTISKS
jgi:hypothetical protein